MHSTFTDNLICFTDRLIDSQHLINRLILMCLFPETGIIHLYIIYYILEHESKI